MLWSAVSCVRGAHLSGPVGVGFDCDPVGCDLDLADVEPLDFAAHCLSASSTGLWAKYPNGRRA